MDQKKLDKAFQEAYHRASTTSLRFPQDVMLRFYAFYKLATEEDSTHKHTELSLDGTKLVSGFKLNSLFQIKNLTTNEAKEHYIDLVNEYIPKKESL